MLSDWLVILEKSTVKYRQFTGFYLYINGAYMNRILWVIIDYDL